MTHNRKKILIFSLAYFPKHVGGAEVALKEITDRIPDIEFHMVCLRFDSTLPKVELIGNILVHRIGFSKRNPSMADLRKFPLHLNKVLYQFAAFFKAVTLHRKHHYHGIWAMMAHSTGVPAGLMKTIYPTLTYVLTLQEGDPPEYIERKMRIFGPLFTRAFRKADVMQCISTFLEQWGRRMGFRGRSVVIPNAVNVMHFSEQYPEKLLSRLKIELGKGIGDIFLITTSRLVHKNAVDDCISALALLPQEVKLLVLGTGPDETALREHAEKLNVSERIQFLGQKSHEELPRYLNASDIFIRPSRSEGMGNSFVEAMAAGLPVIATQEGGLSDFIFDEKRNPDKPITAWAVSKDSPQEIAQAVRDIMSRPEKVRAVVETARAMVKDTYDWDIVARSMREKVFENVMS